MNYNRIYWYRFKGVDKEKKKVIWKEIANFFHQKLGNPSKILDSAGGMCEFINASPSKEKWVIDIEDSVNNFVSKDVKTIVGDVLTVDLPENYFDAIFISNFLEHLHSQEEVAFFLGRMFKALRGGGQDSDYRTKFQVCLQRIF